MTENIRPICPRCQSGSVYVRRDDTIRCRRCGYDSKLPVKLVPKEDVSFRYVLGGLKKE